MKTQIRSQSVKSGFSLTEVCVWTAVLVLIGIIGVTAFKTYKTRKYDLAEQRFWRQVLPPGVNDQQNLPEPAILERHVNSDWIFARGKVGWPLVIYCSKGIQITSVRLVETGSPGGLYSYEVMAGRNFGSSVPDSDHPATYVNEVFRTVPLLCPNPLFIQVDNSALDRLKGMMRRL